ncbi:SDR family NAD(P)-dependent oxidoreductase [Mycobacterium sp. 852002-40037_SCH5390672]|uniref:SDR family NAD(P)-dependent oxidoreductase n=1 Tax=Mycobacterium sp. 852002-40037_SCH5390672 TaxID=1834089 RepID=UPI00080584B4|nr:SDR family oxidoreductase [Mycobacterium sp. 852002-40037_SCH5390672]OBB96458.1 short-chain dehydrogenase [Mycobacterium sp. 852002-40037_SCH5390672]
MLLNNKTAIVYGAAGAVGTAVSLAFAQEGARVFVTGRNLEAINTLAKQITAAGGTAEASQVDALDEQAVTEHLTAVAEKAAAVDISFNAIGIPQHRMQGTPLTELSLENFALPITTYAQSHFLTARAAARHMIPRKSGVILMHTPEPARLGIPLLGGMSPAWAAMESLNRAFSAEWAPHGVRTVCLRTSGIEETSTIDVVFGLHAQAYHTTPQEFAARMAANSHRNRATTLAELAQTAVFVASDRASAMTGTVANLTGGIVVD